jgi:hypothetical protein
MTATPCPKCGTLVETGQSLSGPLEVDGVVHEHPTERTSNAQRLGYKHIENGVECLACEQQFFARPNGFGTVEGSVLRGHRRRCPVAPADFPIPGVCNS